MKLICIGDSIMQKNDWRTFPQTGWVQELSRFFYQTVNFKNFAKNGRSTKSFITEGRFDEVLSFCEKGDFALIQFGHNDEKETDPARYTSPAPDGEFRKNLEFFIKSFESKGVLPVLLSPMARRKFKDEKPENTHGLYPEAVKETAEKMNVPFIDMTSLTMKLLEKKGEQASRDFYMNFDAGQYENFPEGKSDNSHLRPAGAFEFSKIAAFQISKIAGTFKSYKPLCDQMITEGLDKTEFENDTGDEKNFA